MKLEGLKGKILINGEILLLTGLHIGGSKGSIEVGEVDNNVIKTSEGIPYIPGSSLKGILRCALEKAYADGNGMPDPKTKIFTNPDNVICRIFGVGAVEKNEYKKIKEDSKSTRLLVRDTYLKEDIQKKMERKSEEFEMLSENYTETKHENVINRQTGGTTSGGLREIERVPAKSIFEFKMIYDIYLKEDIENLKYLLTGFALVQDSFLGGGGTRGYGNICFKNVVFKGKTLQQYEHNDAPVEIIKIVGNEESFNFDLDAIIKKCNEIFIK